MQIYNKLFIKQLFFNTENGDEVRKNNLALIKATTKTIRQNIA